MHANVKRNVKVVGLLWTQKHTTSLTFNFLACKLRLSTTQQVTLRSYSQIHVYLHCDIFTLVFYSFTFCFIFNTLCSMLIIFIVIYLISLNDLCQYFIDLYLHIAESGVLRRVTALSAWLQHGGVPR